MEKLERDRLLLTAMDSYGDYLLRLIYAIVKDEKKAEDIVQEVFIRYYLSLEKFEGRSSVKTYLYRIAVNECHNYYKSWAFRKMEISNLFGHLLVNKDTPEIEILQKESDDNVAKMIEGLPLKYREVIWLHYFSELTVTEISDVLNCPVNTVKTRLARGRKLARIALEEGNDYA
ncbi:sigma-70 family RNA polymerase sigma factor [Sporosarcina thermotolerans]|uniref:Sigma-70 family RNA polymerase sigma factor n=1 Tax=Sporosarcina thermotolerans TaxID=633404 RepID=A0AAW9A9F9_9BACL|nr:sigma-70 family RNA polymerase sigma factor [Sporosarcina thermotolerans]MDW0116545.1 sigma-70 family RNA polymerase sigma factor [Sporosarcina thermotolerans]WHT48763.1 sigma-70 family RNA polymerase sigma factor [Sporosarcina thermotolerans]